MRAGKFHLYLPLSQVKYYKTEGQLSCEVKIPAVQRYIRFTYSIHSGRGGTKSLDKRNPYLRRKILPIVKRYGHTIEKCWTRPQSNLATSSTPPPLEDHGSHRVAGCCAYFYFALPSESGPITKDTLKQLMSAITQKIEQRGFCKHGKSGIRI
jgi:hypothetical protein